MLVHSDRPFREALARHDDALASRRAARAHHADPEADRAPRDPASPAGFTALRLAALLR